MTFLLDVLGVILWICVALIVATGLRPVLRRKYPDFTFLANSWLVGVVAILTIALTYGTVRSQLQQTSDNALQEAGNFFVQAEYDEPTFRCLYDWGAYRQPDDCLARITSDADSYTKTMLYIEEVLYILASSSRDHKLWKSRYTQDINYWREDVALDPTGMFSWFSVIEDSENPGAELLRAGVEIDATTMCRNYRKVHAQLTLRGASPDPLIDCENLAS